MMEQRETTGFLKDLDLRKIRLNLILMMIFDTFLASTILLTYLYSVVGMTYRQLIQAFIGFLWIAPLTMGVYSFMVYLFFRPVLDFMRRYRQHEATDRLTIINAQARVYRGPVAVSLAGLLFWTVGALLMAIWMMNTAGISVQKGWLLVLGGIVAAFGTNSHSLYRLKKMIRPFSRTLSQQSQASKITFKEATSSIKTRYLVNTLSLIIFSLFFSYLTLFSEMLSMMKNQTRLHLESKVVELQSIIRQFVDMSMYETIVPFIDQVRLGSDGYAFLIDTSNDQISTTHINADLYREIKEGVLASTSVNYVEYGRQNLVIAYGPVPGTHFFVGGVITIGDFRPDIGKFALTSFLVIAICLILSMAMANASGEDIVDPIIELINEASLITEGELDHPVYSEGTDEIAVLATAFEKMRLSLSRQMEEKSKKVKELSTLYEMGQQLEKSYSREMKLNALLTSVVYKLNFDRAVLFLIRDDNKHIDGQECRGNNPNNLDPKGLHFTMDDDDELIVQALKNGSAILIEDAESDSTVTKIMKTSFESKSFIILPLKTVAGQIGVLVVDSNTSERNFTQEDLRILSIITNQVMASIRSGTVT